MQVTKSWHVSQFSKHPAQIEPSKKYPDLQLYTIAIVQLFAPRGQASH